MESSLDEQLVATTGLCGVVGRCGLGDALDCCCGYSVSSYSGIFGGWSAFTKPDGYNLCGIGRSFPQYCVTFSLLTCVVICGLHHSHDLRNHCWRSTTSIDCSSPPVSLVMRIFRSCWPYHGVSTSSSADTESRRSIHQ